MSDAVTADPAAVKHHVDMLRQLWGDGATAQARRYLGCAEKWKHPKATAHWRSVLDTLNPTAN